ncbi:alpha-amylase 1 isoform X10 [Pogona vitticeps]
MNAGAETISEVLRGMTWLHLMKRTRALFSKQECKRISRGLPPRVNDNMKSLLLLLLAAFGLCWSQYTSNPQPLRTSIVHLFEWRWVDVALECERYLAPNGFAGVQVSPPNENLVIMNPWRPWWERYQPISYKLCSRSGSEDEFRNMVTRCNNVGVHIYVDAVINHMCSSGAGSGYDGTCGSFFDAAVRDFPAVPYSSCDFNDQICKTVSGDIENYSDPIQVRNCRLSGLVDLAQRKEDVRTKIADYMNRLIDIGVAGFRIDAAKHIWPQDINAILSKVNNLNTQWFTKGSRPFIYQEVIDLGGEAVQSSEYFRNGRVTEFKYGTQLGTVLRKWNGEKMAALKSWGENWNMMPSDKAIVFIDNHDNQRGHGAGGASILTFWNPRNMVRFRNIVYGQSITNWWDNNKNQVAFGRNGKGFVVFNNDDRVLMERCRVGLACYRKTDVLQRPDGDFLCLVHLSLPVNTEMNRCMNGPVKMHPKMIYITLRDAVRFCGRSQSN